MNGFVWFVVLLAWHPDGTATEDSGVVARKQLAECHDKSLAFSRKYDTVIQICQKISEDKYAIIAQQKVSFDWNKAELPVVAPEPDPEADRLRKALLEIGKWHRGKTKDSQRVRAIIKKVLR